MQQDVVAQIEALNAKIAKAQGPDDFETETEKEL